MIFETHVEQTAVEDLEATYRWIARQSPGRAETWLHGAFEAIQTLRSFPRRCPLAPEDDAFQAEIRQLLYGDFRILFTIDGQQVKNLHVRHGARRFKDPQDLP